MKTATEVRDGRLYLATTTDVPTIPYAFAVDRDAREVRLCRITFCFRQFINT
jgi:hypothetical protein